VANPCILRADRARARLSELGLTQGALAERCDVELRTVQRWFAGGRASLVDAERFAAELGLGTAELFEGVPSDQEPAAFASLRAALGFFGAREGTLSLALRAALENFEYFDRSISFAAHPAHGYVARVVMRPTDRDRFAPFRVVLRPGACARLAFHAQVARAFRYGFGEIRIDATRATLVEHFHTRSAVAERAADGAFEVHVWNASEMRELVVVGDHPFAFVRDAADASSLFDLDDPRTEHAVCFRPAPMHLRRAGFSPVFDRIVGLRDGRIDSLQE